MKHEDLMHLFLNYCSKTSLADVSRLLTKNYNEIDLTYNDGKAFIIAGKNSSIDLMKLLLNHYNATKLQSSPASDEYQNAYTILQDILIEVQSQCEVSDKMQSIFDSYNIYKIDTISNTKNTDACTDNSRNEQETSMLEEEINDSNTSITRSPILVGEEEINDILLLTTDNLIAKSYRYMTLNIQAINCFKNNDKDCLMHITDAAILVTSNNNKSSNIEYKSIVLYNYLKFHKTFTDTIPNNKLGLVVINQIENFFKEHVIFIATNDSNTEVLNLFLSNYCTLDISDQHGQTPLHWASDNPEITAILLSTMSNEAILRRAEGNNNYTALHLAVHHKNTKVVELHLNKAPELADVSDQHGQTPLHWASDNPEITAILLNVNIENSLRESYSTIESINESDIFHDEVKLVGINDNLSISQNNES